MKNFEIKFHDKAFLDFIKDEEMVAKSESWYERSVAVFRRYVGGVLLAIILAVTGVTSSCGVGTEKPAYQPMVGEAEGDSKADVSVLTDAASQEQGEKESYGEQKHRAVDRSIYNFNRCITGTKPKNREKLILVKGYASSIEEVKRNLELTTQGGVEIPKVFDMSAVVEAIDNHQNKHHQFFTTFSIVVDHGKDHGDIHWLDIRLNEKAEALLKERGLAALEEKCGDQVVIYQWEGGILKGFLSFTSESSDDLDRFKAELKSKALFEGVEYKGEVSAVHDLSRKYKNIEVDFHISTDGGWGVSVPTGRDLEELNEFIEKWPQMVADNPGHFKDIKISLADITRGMVRDPYYKRAQGITDTIEKYSAHLIKMQNILNGEGGYHIEYTPAIREQLRQLDEGLIKLEGAFLGCDIGENRDECQLHQITEIYEQYGNSKHLVTHHSCPKKSVMVKKTDPKCGMAKGGCLKYDQGKAEYTTSLFLGEYKPRKRDGDPWLRNNELAKAKKSMHELIGQLDSSDYPNVCRDNDASLGHNVLSLDFKWTACDNIPIYPLPSPPCFPGPGDILRKEPEAYQEGVMFASVEVAPTAYGSTLINDPGVLASFGDDDQLSSTCMNGTRDPMEDVPIGFKEVCKVEVTSDVRLSCFWETDKCDKWEYVAKTCLLPEEQTGTCQVKLRDL